MKKKKKKKKRFIQFTQVIHVITQQKNVRYNVNWGTRIAIAVFLLAPQNNSLYSVDCLNQEWMTDPDRRHDQELNPSYNNQTSRKKRVEHYFVYEQN